MDLVAEWHTYSSELKGCSPAVYGEEQEKRASLFSKQGRKTKKNIERGIDIVENCGEKVSYKDS